jgi:hypothetical protein
VVVAYFFEILNIEVKNKSITNLFRKKDEHCYEQNSNLDGHGHGHKQ